MKNTIEKLEVHKNCYIQKGAVKQQHKIQEIEDLSVIEDISLIYSKLKGTKKGYQPNTFFVKTDIVNLLEDMQI